MICLEFLNDMWASVTGTYFSSCMWQRTILKYVSTLKTSVVFLDMFVTVETVKATAKMTRQLTFF